MYRVPQAPNWCGPYFKRSLPVLAYLGETHDTAVGSPKRPHKTPNHIHTVQPVEAGGTIVLQRLVSYKKLQQARPKSKRAQLRYLRHAKANTYNTK